MAKGVQADRDTHRVRGPDRGAQQDEPGHRPGSGLDGAAAPDDGAVRPHLTGLPVYKMTGSGNDFVMVDGRSSGPGDWSVPDIRAVCARGTGIGADGLVFVAPGTAPGVVRMAYFNSDGSRAAMCGNAALCSTQLAARLGLANGRGMRLETDAGTYESRCAPGERAELRLAPVRAPQQVPGVPLADGERRRALSVARVPRLIRLGDGGGLGVLSARG